MSVYSQKGFKLIFPHQFRKTGEKNPSMGNVYNKWG